MHGDCGRETSGRMSKISKVVRQFASTKWKSGAKYTESQKVDNSYLQTAINLIMGCK